MSDTDARGTSGATTDGKGTMTTETMTEVVIECHDGKKLHIGRSTGFEHVRSGVEGVSLTRPHDSHVHIPAEDIPDVIAALQRFVDAEESR